MRKEKHPVLLTDKYNDNNQTVDNISKFFLLYTGLYNMGKIPPFNKLHIKT